MTVHRLFSAFARRECMPHPFSAALLIAVAAGMAAGVIAHRFPDAHYGSIMMIVNADRTAVGVLVVIAAFRTISRMSDDTSAAWLQQLTASGATRATYVIALVLAVTAALAVCYVVFAWAFSGTAAVLSGNHAAAVRALTTFPLVTMLLFAAASFGAVVYGIAGPAAARGAAALLLGAPWVIVWIAVISGIDFPVWLARIVTRQAPPMAVSLSVGSAAWLFAYSGMALALALALGERRVARL